MNVHAKPGDHVDQSGEPNLEHSLAQVSGYYAERFAEHGSSHAGVDWNSSAGQLVRFQQLDRVWRGPASSRDLTICDFGSGYGAYAQHLQAAGFEGTYIGVEIVQAMTRAAKRLDLPTNRFQWVASSFPRPADFVVASGTFNVFPGCAKREQWTLVVNRLSACWEVSREALVVNFLLPPTEGFPIREELFTPEPHQILELLTNLGGRVLMVSDYGLHEITYISYRHEVSKRMFQ